MSNIHIMPRNIINSKRIYEFISLLWARYKQKTNSNIFLDFKSTKVIELNMMAPLGMILTKIKSNKNKVYLRNMSDEIKKLLFENGFLVKNNFSSNNNEIFQNYILYTSFSADENNKFRMYIISQLNDIKDSEVISLLISRIMEIFINVKMHARVKNDQSRFGNKEVFSSGIYYKSKNYILFSIANNGLTFKENIKKNAKLTLEQECDYIKWGVQKANSTRGTLQECPGGLGLYLLVELIKECRGELIILSGKGFYKYNANKISECESIDFNCSYPGTVITVKVPIKAFDTNKIEVNFNSEFNVFDLLEGGV